MLQPCSPLYHIFTFPYTSSSLSSMLSLLPHLLTLPYVIFSLSPCPPLFFTPSLFSSMLAPPFLLPMLTSSFSILALLYTYLHFCQYSHSLSLSLSLMFTLPFSPLCYSLALHYTTSSLSLTPHASLSSMLSLLPHLLTLPYVIFSLSPCAPLFYTPSLFSSMLAPPFLLPMLTSSFSILALLYTYLYFCQYSHSLSLSPLCLHFLFLSYATSLLFLIPTHSIPLTPLLILIYISCSTHYSSLIPLPDFQLVDSLFSHCFLEEFIYPFISFNQL